MFEALIITTHTESFCLREALLFEALALVA
jgi:hypothetical protein